MKIGLITYHAAYNYGSVLQAYATKTAIKHITGIEPYIINYRMDEQKNYYGMYRTKYGVKVFIEDLAQFPLHKKRKKRANAFEKYITNNFKLTVECSEPNEAIQQEKRFDVMISGSDQLWNKYSLELHTNTWDYMYPFLLKGCNNRKISYASSIGNMPDEGLQKIKPDLLKFDSIAMRESSSAKKVEKLLNREIPWVLDPTFLLTREEWIKKFMPIKNSENGRYILYYALNGPRQLHEIIPILKKIAIEKSCKVKLITPFAYLPVDSRIFEYHPEYGPDDFLRALYDADLIITNSYHGTILSVNMHKQFYSLCQEGGSAYRKTDILQELDLSDRIILNLNDLLKKDSIIDYSKVEIKLNKLRTNSVNYLIRAIEK